MPVPIVKTPVPITLSTIPRVLGRLYSAPIAAPIDTRDPSRFYTWDPGSVPNAALTFAVSTEGILARAIADAAFGPPLSVLFDLLVGNGHFRKLARVALPQELLCL